MFTPSVEWFESWFDSPYYHILYQNRDYREAESFITKMVAHLSIPQNSTSLDLACGKGRHSIFLNKLGLDVVGLDLSENNIKHAQKYENESLHFDVHDMREVYKLNHFDVIFNLFTSFGYFDCVEENNQVVSSIYSMLQENGRLVLDFMNVDYALNHLVEEEQKLIDGINFHISRRYDEENIIKTITFEDSGEKFTFEEKVQAIRKKDFEDLLKKNGFIIEEVFGDYALSAFDFEKSDRLIFIAKKG